MDSLNSDVNELSLGELTQQRIKQMDEGSGVLFDAEVIKKKARARQSA